jgi:hypothetical protein
MALRKYLLNALAGASAAVFAGAKLVPGTDEPGPVVAAAAAVVRAPLPAIAATTDGPTDAMSTKITAAVNAIAAAVRPLSHPRALEDAFRSYFAYKAAHPEAVKKPLLYFVDYGLPSTTPRGYVFDMESKKIVEGPFTVAHGRGSAANQKGVPTRFSNASGSAATSLGLFVAQELYPFGGKSAGSHYSSVGLRLMGVSGDFNDNARARGVVAHGAPYVTPDKAGRSEGCPAMEQARAKRLLPMLANGALVFLFAPDAEWMRSDPWVVASGQ